MIMLKTSKHIQVEADNLHSIGGIWILVVNVALPWLIKSFKELGFDLIVTCPSRHFIPVSNQVPNIIWRAIETNSSRGPARLSNGNLDIRVDLLEPISESIVGVRDIMDSHVNVSSRSRVDVAVDEIRGFDDFKENWADWIGLLPDGPASMDSGPDSESSTFIVIDHGKDLGSGVGVSEVLICERDPGYGSWENGVGLLGGGKGVLDFSILLGSIPVLNYALVHGDELGVGVLVELSGGARDETVRIGLVPRCVDVPFYRRIKRNILKHAVHAILQFHVTVIS